jgi:hypothetical protein
MFKNYLLVALRNLSRNKIFSLINVLGLSIGISASLVIFLIVQYHYSFDRFETKANRMFRVVCDFAFQGDPGHSRGVPAPLGDAIRKYLSGIENIVVFRYYSPHKLEVKHEASVKPEVFKEQNHIIFADAHYFDFCPIAGSLGKKIPLQLRKDAWYSMPSRETYFPNFRSRICWVNKSCTTIRCRHRFPASLRISTNRAKRILISRVYFPAHYFKTVLSETYVLGRMGSTTSDHQVWFN